MVSTRKHSKLYFTRIVVLFCVAILMLVLMLAMYHEKRSFKSDINKGEEHVEQLTKSISRYIELSFLAVDLILRRAVERQHFNSLFGFNLHRDMEYNLRMWIDESPHISSLLLTNEFGIVKLMASKDSATALFNVGDSLSYQDYFMNHNNFKDTELIIRTFEPNDLEHAHLIIMSRRLNKLDGSFGGTVIAVMDTKYITNFFHSIEVEKQTNMTMIMDDGNIMTIGNQANADITAISAIIANSNLVDHEGQKVTTFAAKELRSESNGEKSIVLSDGQVINLSSIAELEKTALNSIGTPETNWSDDGTFRILSFKHLPNLPITISLALFENDIFENWRTNRKSYFLFLLIFAGFASVITFFTLAIAKQVRRVQKSEEAAVLASQAKSEFLAKMSHELRTPLNAIIGFSEMMDSGYFGPLNDKQKERNHDINLCGNHLLELINDILEFSKGEAGKLTIQDEGIELLDIVEKCLRIIGQRAKMNDIAIINKIDDSLPLLRADERKIRQILLNLLSNAVKFTSNGGEVTISARVDESDNFIMSVKDTGIGIAQEDIPKALSVFEQVHNSKHQEGTGLGLPLCKMFAELHGGSLKLNSVKGKGTTVSIVLPASRVIKYKPHELESDEKQASALM